MPGDADLPLAEWLAASGQTLVAQERVRLSTTPVWTDEGLRPRPMSLRVFLARGELGWSVMKGGYARIGRSDDASAIAMQAGGTVADVWVMGEGPVPRDTMVAPPSTRPFRTALPARAADNLYWLGRYVERAEIATRLLRAWHLRRAEAGISTEEDEGENSPLLSALSAHLRRHGIDPASDYSAEVARRIDSARACAGRLRDRFSADGWQSLNDLSALAHDMQAAAPGMRPRARSRCCCAAWRGWRALCMRTCIALPAGSS